MRKEAEEADDKDLDAIYKTAKKDAESGKKPADATAATGTETGKKTETTIPKPPDSQ